MKSGSLLNLSLDKSLCLPRLCTECMINITPIVISFNNLVRPLDLSWLFELLIILQSSLFGIDYSSVHEHATLVKFQKTHLEL